MKKLLLVLCLFCFFATLQAQNTKLIAAKTFEHKPLLIAILPLPLFADAEQKLAHRIDASAYDMLLINSALAANEARDSINLVLNTASTIQLQKVYLCVVGNDEIIEKFSYYKRDFFAHKENITENEWKMTNIDNLMASFSRHYTWLIALEDIQREYASDIARNKQEGGIGFAYGLNLTQKSNTDNYIPSFFTSYTLFGYYRIDKKWQFNTDLTFSYKLPDTEAIQAELQSKISPSQLMSGGSVSIPIKQTMSSHVFVKLGTEIIRFMKPKNAFRPYIGLGLSGAILTGMQVTIDTTIVINTANMQGGGGFGGGERPNFASGNAPKLNTIVSFVPTVGFVYELGEKVNFIANAKYSIDTNLFDEYKIPAINNFSISVGLALRLKTKKKLFYDYLR
jgi:hypothetical protein